MADDNYQHVEQSLNYIRVGHLPYGITAKEITAFFQPFGTVKNLHLKRRVNKDSPIFLPNPFVILSFDNPECIDQIMAARPFFMGDCRLFIRRFIPITPKYPNEAFLTVKKILIRTQSEKDDEILPDDASIVEYLSRAGGNIEYFERLDNKTVLVQFIKNQPVEIEKCSDEEQVRRQLEFQQK
jgi:RNA recognition motif-containing protein